MQNSRRPFRTFLIALTVLLGAMVFTSCEDAGEQPIPETAKVRLLHMAYDAPNVDLRADGTVLSSGVAALRSSGYQTLSAGTRRIAVTNVGASAELLTSTETLKASTSYSVVVLPPAAAVSGILLEEPRLIPTGSSVVRLINATTDAGAVELRVAGSNSALVGPVGQAAASDVKETTAGSYILSLYRGSSLLAEFSAFSFAPQTSYTVVVHGTISTTDDVPFGVRVFLDGGDGTAYTDLTPTSLDANVIMVNALVGAQAVNAIVDGQTVATAIPYGQHTPYTSIQPGRRLFSFVSGGTPVISGDVTFASRASYTIFGTGTIVPPDVAPIVLEDVTVPNAAQALVRFVNVSPDAGSVDVLTPVGATDYQIPAMQGIDFREVSTSVTTGSNFLQLPASPAGAPYLLKFRKTGTTTIMTTLENVALEAGKIYTLWLGGRASNTTLSAYLIKHN